jgi:hypothetical protein
MRARRASTGREGELAQRATRLRKSVEPLLPTLMDGCPPARFEKLRAALEKVREARDEEKRLASMTRWGDPMVRAYAGLLRFHLEPELPALLVARYPFGEVSFAPLARTTKEAQIAVQQYDDPRRLMLGYLDLTKRGFHFFATDSKLLCTGPSPEPPAEFRSALAHDLPYRMDGGSDGRSFACPHLAAKEPVPLLRVDWPGAQTSFRVCRRCAKGDRQLLASVTGRLAVPKPEKAFPFDLELNVDCQGGSGCAHANLPGPSRAIRKGYLFGRLSDAEALDAYRKEAQARLDQVGGTRFVAAGVCYGSDSAAFIGALEPTPEERRALQEVLPSVSGHFEVPEPRASQALERLWHDHADQIVAAIVPDPERAERLVREARASPGRVSELLNRAAKDTRERELLGQLPEYTQLSSEASLADRAARAYRIGGIPAATKAVLSDLPREGKERGLAYGILLAIDQASTHDWQFADTEREFGRSLRERARKLIDAPPAEYDAALGSLLGAAGVAEWGRRVPAPG